jgi:DNA topoisomerase-1
VLSSNGHIKTLPSSTTPLSDLPKNFNESFRSLGIDVANDYNPLYVPVAGSKPITKGLLQAAREAEAIYLATDPDREGESISSDIQDLFIDNGINDVPIHRIKFSSITSAAITEALNQPTTVDYSLVQAQNTRRILDRLTGFTLSPILWKAVAPGLSAGRVQSVGLREIVSREQERMAFVPGQFCSLESTVQLYDTGSYFNTTLTAINSVDLVTSSDISEKGTADPNKLLLTPEQQRRISLGLIGSKPSVKEITKRTITLSPPPPFITSSLQSSASASLGLSVNDVMRVAQGLYEKGFISYMRTDNTVLSPEAVAVGKQVINDAYGSQYVRSTPLKGKNKKGAQEGHEPIRPAIHNSTFLHPAQLPGTLSRVESELYGMIYMRTLRCLASDETREVTAVKLYVEIGEERLSFKGSGSSGIFDGFKAIGVDENEESTADGALPPLTKATPLTITHAFGRNHTTQPPPRFSESSFVRRLEELGVGRPSTYGNVIVTLRSRGYILSGGDMILSGQRIKSIGKSMVPSLTAFAVTKMLSEHCEKFVTPSFTASMENSLDEIASGNEAMLPYLRSFYEGEDGLKETSDRMLGIIAGYANDTAANHESRRVTLPNFKDDESIGVYVGPYGAYVMKSSPSGELLKAPLPVELSADIDALNPLSLEKYLNEYNPGGVLIGVHPETGLGIRVCEGKFGQYVKMGEVGDAASRTVTLPARHGGEDVSLDTALRYLALPRVVGSYESQDIHANIGRYGPYLRWNSKFVSLPPTLDVLTVGEEVAIELVKEGIVNKQFKQQNIVVDFGVIEEGSLKGESLTVRDGQYGLYIKCGRTNAAVPKRWRNDVESMSLRDAMGIITEKRGLKVVVEEKKVARVVVKTEATKEEIAPPTKGEKLNIVEELKAKRPPSAYLKFCAATRPSVLETRNARGEAFSFGEITKELAKRWAALGEDGKMKWKEGAKGD